MNEYSDKNEPLSEKPLKRLFDKYASGVGYISVIKQNGNEGIGSCFHIGDGVYITARHVVEGCIIKKIGIRRVTTTDFKGPFFHPDPKIDVAALVVPDLKAPTLPLGSHLDDWLDDAFLFTDAMVLGYPPIPFARKPYLFVAKAEINAVIDKYTGGHPHFILSSMARGGFSGGPAISEWDFVLGVITESLISESQPVELGYFSVLTVEAIYGCISHHRIVPKALDELWEGFWNKESMFFAASPSQHVNVSIYRGHGNFYFEIFSYRLDVIIGALKILDETFNNFYSLTWIHDSMIKAEFKPNSLTENTADNIYVLLIKMVDGLGIKRYRDIKDTDQFNSLGQPF